MVDGASTIRKGFIQGLSPMGIEVAEVVKGAGLKIRSQMGSRVQIPPSIPYNTSLNDGCLHKTCKTV